MDTLRGLAEGESGCPARGRLQAKAGPLCIVLASGMLFSTAAVAQICVLKTFAGRGEYVKAALHLFPKPLD